MGFVLKPSSIIKQFRTSWKTLPDPRQPNNNTQHSVTDALLLAFAVFFFQQPSFLAAQRELARRKGRDNTVTLFETQTTPTENQIRNILDGFQPDDFHEDYYALLGTLEKEGYLLPYKKLTGTYHIALDGVTYHESKEISCPNCTQRKDKTGVVHYYHQALIAMLTQPDSAHVLAFPPECMVPQDGSLKQDCEQEAAKRWVKNHLHWFEAESVTLLGDDLFSKVPLCRLIREEYQQYFLFVCKPDSHKKLYETLTALEQVGSVETVRHEKWHGSARRHEVWSYRFVNEVPLTGDADTIFVNWLELAVTDKATGQIIYRNSWVSNHYFASHTVEMWGKIGRSRWKVENEGINVLKNQGYHLEHNFGHGRQMLSNVLFTLNILAFLVHTVLHLAYEPYRLLREELKTRQKFFKDLSALVSYIVFDSWESLFEFMIEALELKLSP